MFGAINGMLLDMLAALARKDYDDRRRRQAQGQAKAGAEGKYKGRPEDTQRNAGIASSLPAFRLKPAHPKSRDASALRPGVRRAHKGIATTADHIWIARNRVKFIRITRVDWTQPVLFG
jgi:hypothetical protein